MNIQQPILNVQHLRKRYPKVTLPAVDDISLSIRSGEILALLGPNGAGKTSIVKMISGLILPDAGNVSIMGHDVVLERKQAIRHLGVILEGARNLYWRLSARENLLYFGRLRGVSTRQLRTRIDELLNLLGLKDVQDQEVRHFSRGMQQKLAIAAALIHDPPLLLLDEPTLGLDVQAARQLQETIALMAKEQGKAVLLTTHIMPLAEQLADRIFVIHHGREIAHAETATLLRQFNGRQQQVRITTEAPLPARLQAILQRTYPDMVFGEENEPSFFLHQSPQKDTLAVLQILDRHGVQIVHMGREQRSLEDILIQLISEGEGMRARRKEDTVYD